MESHSRRVPLEKRKRTETSCDKCRLRKQKCDRLLGQGQCRYCEINGIPCSTTQPRKQRVFGNDEGLRSRLGVLESLVKGLVPEADLSSIDEMQQLGKSLGIPLPVDDTSVDLDRSARNSVKQEDEYNLPLLPDQQGQVQFIGPASSFSFHHKLRRLIGNYSTYEFAMFGNNAADQYDASDISSASHMADSGERRGRIASITGRSDCSSPSDAVSEIDGPVLDSLIDTYFDIIHSDFPVLHEASFREAYELCTDSIPASSLNCDPRRSRTEMVAACANVTPNCLFQYKHFYGSGSYACSTTSSQYDTSRRVLESYWNSNSRCLCHRLAPR
jgi:hypothetical protein